LVTIKIFAERKKNDLSAGSSATHPENKGIDKIKKGNFTPILTLYP